MDPAGTGWLASHPWARRTEHGDAGSQWGELPQLEAGMPRSDGGTVGDWLSGWLAGLLLTTASLGLSMDLLYLGVCGPNECFTAPVKLRITGHWLPNKAIDRRL